MWISDWSSDVFSSYLPPPHRGKISLGLGNRVFRSTQAAETAGFYPGGLIPSASSRFDLRRIDSPSASYYETITSVRFHDFTIPHPRRTAGGSLHFREPDMTLYSIYQSDPITGHMNIVVQIECASDL